MESTDVRAALQQYEIAFAGRADDELRYVKATVGLIKVFLTGLYDEIRLTPEYMTLARMLAELLRDIRVTGQNLDDALAVLYALIEEVKAKCAFLLPPDTKGMGDVAPLLQRIEAQLCTVEWLKQRLLSLRQRSPGIPGR